MSDRPLDSENDETPSAADSRSAPRGSLIENLLRRATKVAGGTLDKAMDVATLSAVFGDSWLRDLVSSGASPERLEAMAEAGHFLRDARVTAGLSLKELADSLELKDDQVLDGVEKGEAILPLEVMLRSASLLARHDPIPFLLKFLRSYNPQLEATLEQWGVMALPRNFERERRFVNLYRQHDFLRELSDDEHQRFIEYMDASTKLVVEVMQREARAPRHTSAPVREARSSRGSSGESTSPPSRVKNDDKKGAGAEGREAKRKVKSRPRARVLPSKSSPGEAGPDNSKARPSGKRPVVRKVKPRSS
ncbi:MAG: hypothetical protein AB8B57_15140 [Congregibacter sp.]